MDNVPTIWYIISKSFFLFSCKKSNVHARSLEQLLCIFSFPIEYKIQPRWETYSVEDCRSFRNFVSSSSSLLTPYIAIVLSLSPFLSLFPSNPLKFSFHWLRESFPESLDADLVRVRRPTKWRKNVFESLFTDFGSRDKLFNSF